MIDLWGLESEIARWHEIRNDEDARDLTDTEASDIVLSEDWPSKLRKIHIQKIETHLSRHYIIIISISIHFLSLEC